MKANSESAESPDAGGNVQQEIAKLKDILTPIDSLLSTWVSIANSSGGELGVTLSVSGAIISGWLIGVRTYVDLLLDSLASSEDLDTSALGERLHKLLTPDDADRELPEDPTAATDEHILAYLKSEPRYIHLRDARVFSPTGVLPGNRGVLWRGALDRVDGWTFGILQADS